MPYHGKHQTVFLPEGDPEQVSLPVADYPYPGMIGAKFTVQQPGPRGTPGTAGTVTEEFHEKTYQLVRTDSSMSVAPYKGAVAWWQNTGLYRTTTDPTALGRGRIAGIYQRSWRAAGDLMCVQKEGPATVKFVDAPTQDPTIAGLHVIPSATAAKADCLAAGTAPTYPLLGLSASAINAGDQTAVVQLSVDETTP